MLPFVRNIFECILDTFKWKVIDLMHVSLAFAHKGPSGHKPALAQMMARRRPNDKQLSELTML